MSRMPLIVGNWKLNTSLAEAQALAVDVVNAPVAGVKTVLCPPFPWLVPLAEVVRGSDVALGAQDCWPEPAGAFTGDVSAAMLAPLCRYVIVGHSERRALHGEDDALVARKLAAALAAGLLPILCVGDRQEQRAGGDADSVVTRQLRRALQGQGFEHAGRLVVAYEPVWAIGTGEAATPDHAATMAELIRARLVDQFGGAAQATRILYGGSVSEANLAELLAGEQVDGALVGGASLDAVAFNAIRRAAAP